MGKTARTTRKAASAGAAPARQGRGQSTTKGDGQERKPRPAGAAPSDAPVAGKAPAKIPVLLEHPDAALLPMMSASEFAALKADIAANGQREPIILHQGKILDGRNRYRACVELGIQPITEKWDGKGDPAWFVYARANHRHLTDSQKAAVAVQLEERLAEEATKIRLANLKQFQSDAEPGSTSARGNSRDIAGSFFGVSGRYVSAAKELKQKCPELFREVFDGSLPITRAKRKYLRQVKAEQLHGLAKRAARQTGDRWQVICGDALDELRNMRGGTARLIVTDPPYNLGIDYGRGVKADRMDDDEYVTWCASWLDECHRILAPDGALFLINASRWCGEMQAILDRTFGRKGHRATIAWIDTFGNYTTGNFTDCWRPILYYVRDPRQYVWHGEQILIPSDRQTKHGDARADPAGKVPSNVWTEFPRLVDNHPERLPGFPTQIPQALVERIILVASEPGDLVIDPFNGSGTTGAAALTHGRRYIGIDNVEANVKAARLRLSTVVPAAPTKGADR